MTESNFLDVALYHHAAGRPVIAVKKDKKPTRPWGEWLTVKQTEEEVRNLFSRPAYGLAVLTWPASDLVVLDFDGPHAESTWNAQGIELPETARSKTQSGGVHLTFRIPLNGNNVGLKRAVRLVKTNGCGCAKICGVDLLVNGYFITPSTPGYHEDPEATLEHISSLPEEVLKLTAKLSSSNGDGRTHNDSDHIREGERNSKLTSLAGTMQRRGMSYEALLAALREENKKRCDPPLDQNEVEAIAKSISRYPPKKEEGTAGRADGERKKAWVVTMDNVTEERTEWLWKGRIPRRRQTVLGGDPGSGKSFCSLAVAASVTRGEALPGDEKPSSPHNVLLISTEDGYSDVCKPRLRVLGADMARIYIPEPERNLTPSLIMSALEHLVKASDPKLVILDPLMAFAAGKSVKEASIMRQLLAPIASLAEKFDFALLIICHLNKSQAKSLYRIQESIDLVALARSVFIFANDPDDKERHIIAHAKSSLGVKMPSLSFYIRDDGNAGRFEWGEQVNIDVDELLSSDETKKRDNSQLLAAQKWLQEILANGPVSSNIVKDRVQEAGFAWRTVWRAKEELNVKARKERGSGEWFWRL